MANQITLGATLLFDGGDGTGGAPDDLSGAATGTTDTSTFLQGSTSYTASFSNSRAGMLYDAGSAQDYSSNVFYLTVNSGVVGLLTDFRVRFCGATVTDFFEVDMPVGANWPTSISGGWVTFIVDIEDAKADAGRITGGTEPATNAIRYVGFSQLLSVMPKMADNTWFDTLYRLPDGTAGIIVEGRNGGSTDWNAADILTQLGSGQMFYFQGAGGSYTLTTSIQFGINDTTTHGFTDTNVVWLFENQTYVPSDLYGLSALGNVGGTTNVTLGNKTGTGAAASGAQGFTISAAAAGARWFMDFDDPNLDTIGIYGCSLQHGGTFQLDDAAVDMISSLLIDSTSAVLTGSNFLKNKVITPNTAANEAAVTVVTLNDIEVGEFVSGGNGHAVQLGNIASDTAMTWDAIESGYVTGTAGSSVDDKTPTGDETLDCDVDSGFTLTVNVAAGASTPSVANAGLGDVDVVVGQTTFSFTVNPSITGYEWRLYEASGSPGDGTIGTVELDGEEVASADNQSYVYTHSVDEDVAVQIMADGYEEFLHYDTLTDSDKDLTFNLVPETNT